MELHKLGFRAQHARIAALAAEHGAGPQARAVIADTAWRYGVPLVEREDLEAVALEHGVALDDELRPGWRRRQGPPVPPPAPDLFAYDAEVDMWICGRSGEPVLMVGAGPVLRAAVARGRRGRVAVNGREVGRGDALALVDGAVAVRSPLAGRVLAVNRALVSDPGRFAARGEVRSWVAYLDVSNDQPEPDWRASLTLALADARPEPLADAGGSLDALEPEPASLFADAAAATAHFAAFFGELTAPVTARVEALGVSLRLELFDPEAEVEWGEGPPVTLLLTAARAHQLFAGGLDVAAAVNAGDVGVVGSRARALALLSVLRATRQDYAVYAAGRGVG